MVGKITSGYNIRGAINYNENKVKEGKAELIGANSYHKDAHNLTFKEKLNRLVLQAELRERVEHRCVHISLNFDPSEKFTDSKLLEIVDEYMLEIGFGEQPFLVYRHNDTHHPHVHIVTTSIFPDGTQKNLHNLGRKDNFLACRKIEESHGLIAADKKQAKEVSELKPADLKALEYSEKETKAEIGKILLPILKHYHFGSIKELNAILQLYNVCADPGLPGSRMAMHNGLVYSLLKDGKRVGKPIKSSRYFFKVKLSDLEKLYEKGEKAKKEFKHVLSGKIKSALSESKNVEEFESLLSKLNVKTVFRTNAEGFRFGVTFIDSENYCVFNGSDVGKDYSCKKILDRLSRPYIYQAQYEETNKQFTDKIIAQTDFSKGHQKVLSEWISYGLYAFPDKRGRNGYSFKYGHCSTPLSSFSSVPGKIAAYLNANGYTPKRVSVVKKFLDNYASKFHVSAILSPIASIPLAAITPFINQLFQTTDNDPVDSHWLQEAKKRKKRRRNI